MNNKNQGSGTEQFDHNTDINNEVCPHAPIRSMLPSSTSLTAGRDERLPDLNLPFEENSNTVPNNESNIGPLELINISSSSSLTRSDPQRFPDSLSGSNVLQHQGTTTHSIAQINIDSSAEVVGNHHDINLDLSLSLYPIGSQQVKGMDGTTGSANTRVLPSKRRYSDLAGGEFSTGESSRRRGTQLGIADQHLAANSISQANSSNCLTDQLANVLQSSEGSFPNMQNQGQVVPTSQAVTLGMAQQLAASSHANNSNNNLNLPSYYSTELANVHRSSQVDTAIGNQGLVPNMPNQSHAAVASHAPLYIRATTMPNGYSRGLNATTLSYDQARSLNQSGHSPSATSVPPLRNANDVNSSEAARSGTRSRRGLGHPPIPIFAPMLFPENPELRARILNQVQATLEHLDTTGMRPMGPANDRHITIQVIQILRIVHIPAHAANQNSGLTEEEILNHIKRENFVLVGEESSKNEEKCVVCQEEYVNGEEVGRLDICAHCFHVNCIKQWLLIKNLCPICKQTALAISG